ncbi:DNA ligase D [Hydrocarboniphaga effusa]|uniref:DNA ligase D n=1 Tax=Hydrocarboniphaga effusa TaxID=243629 RepID=UPI00398BCCEE
MGSPTRNPSSRKTRQSGPRRSTASRPPALESVELQLATLVDRSPSADDWVYEIKFDGYRLLARRYENTVALRSRNGLNWTDTFPFVRDALGALSTRSAILDGELCYVRDDGLTSFQRLQRALPRGGGEVPREEQKRLVFYIFDLLFVDGEDLRPLPLLARKERLRKLLGAKPTWPLAYSAHLESDGRTALTQACHAGLEGLIAKRAASPYEGGRSSSWLKLKCHKRQEFVIVGFLPAEGSRIGFRSLLLASREDGELRFNGKVGTGFDHASLTQLGRQLQQRVISDPAVANPPRLRNAVWVKPDLVCEVEFTEMTKDGSLRHPSFQGLREDKPARQVVRERVKDVESVTGKSQGRTARASSVSITHPDRVIDPASGVSKGELAQYHQQVSEWLLPYADNRPLALVRCPQGNASQCFFQKQKLPGFSDEIEAAKVAGHDILFTRSARGLLELVQFNAVELHGWGATAAYPDRPDWLVIDLDPDTHLPFSAVVEAAREVRGIFDQLKMISFVKTTGGKGLHVVVPILPRAGWETVKGFTQSIAVALEQHAPTRYVATMTKAKRVGKIFVDYLRNGQGATAVLPYSPRARPGVTVAMPVAWRDLPHLDPRDFDVRSAPGWLRKRRKDPWADFFSTRQVLPDFHPPATQGRRKR